jgi:hypothetical protein
MGIFNNAMRGHIVRALPPADYKGNMTGIQE